MFNSNQYASICNEIYNYDLNNDCFPELDELVKLVLPEGEPKGYTGLTEAVKSSFATRMSVRSAEYWHVDMMVKNGARERRDKADRRMSAFMADLRGDGLLR